MTSRSVLIAAAVVLSAALTNPTDSFAQRQRSPGGNGGGRQERNGGGERQRENGGGEARQRDGGGGARQQDAGARPQGGGNGRAEARAAQPRGEPVDRGNAGNRTRGDSARREAPSETRESISPPQVRPIQPAATASDAGSQDRQARRRFPTAADRVDASTPPQQVRPIQPPATASDAGSQDRQARRRFPTNADRVDANRGGTVTDNRVDRGGVVRGVDRTPNGSRVAVPRARAPQRWDDRNERNFYGSYYGGRNVYGRYAYRGSRNIYIVPRGYTYYYYPRYYYNPYSFGYGPAGRGHFYFDLYYNSYIWHPYGVYRYDTYGSYGYPVGELRLKVHPNDAQVFIDGSYAGRVDEFDGIFQSLRLEEGEYQVEIVAPGYEPLAFDVRIFPGEKTTYEGDLIPERP